LSAVVNDHDLVKLLENAFTSLIQRNKGCCLEDIGHDAKRFGIIQSCRSIETSSRVVPTEHDSPGSHHFCDRHSLSFTTGNTSNERIADFRIASMRDVQHTQKQFKDFISELFLFLFRQSFAGSLGSESKHERLPDSKGWKVIVILLIVDDFGRELFAEFDSIYASVSNISVDGHVGLSLICD